MTGKRTVSDWLSDIVEWGNRLDRHLTGVTREQFLGSELLQDGASKCAEAIGVAAGELIKLNPALDETHPDLQLRLAYMSRDRLSHGYYSLDRAILWSTVADAIPRTVAAARKLLPGRDA
jgi:uncharacterized protein with HEPN domain